MQGGRVCRGGRCEHVGGPRSRQIAGAQNGQSREEEGEVVMAQLVLFSRSHSQLSRGPESLEVNKNGQSYLQLSIDRLANEPFP